MPDADLAGAVARAKTRLDTLDYYPAPVRVDRVRIRAAPWFFRIPGFRRYHGYAFWRTILVRDADPSDDLVTHELCHIWQGQQRALDSMLKQMTTRYSPARTRSRPAEPWPKPRAMCRTPGMAEADARARPRTTEGPARAEPSVDCEWVELRDRDAVAVSDDLAARDLGLVRDHRLELLVADPGRDDARRLLALLGVSRPSELKMPSPASIR